MTGPSSDPTTNWERSSAPVLLTPVRLETRYLATAGTPALAIRVIPDDIARYDFEAALTSAEHDAGAGYWSAVASGADPDTAWVRVQSQLGNARGAWAIDVTRPDSTISDPGTRTTVQAATSLILPDLFTFRGMRDGKVLFSKDGLKLPADLQLGPDWSTLNGDKPADPADRHPWAGTGTKWMVDLDEAIRVGMAVTVPLADTNLAFDYITVIGVSSADAADGADRFARTLQGQLYTSGMGYPPAGSPTNNTPETRSQWSSAPTMRSPADVDAAIAAAAPGVGQPGVALADALGLPDDVRPGVAGRRDLLAAPLGTTATDPDGLVQRAHHVVSTYYRMLTSGGRLTSTDVAAHFDEFVRAAGPLPVLRVGRQPYGVLPVTDLFSWLATDPPDVSDAARESAAGSLAIIATLIALSPHLSADPRRDEDPVLLGLLQRQPTPTQLRALNDTHTVQGETRPPGTAAPFAPSMSIPFDTTPSQPADPAHPPVWPLAAVAAHPLRGQQDPAIDTDFVITSDLNALCHHNGAYWALQAYAALHWQGAIVAAHDMQPPLSTTQWTDVVNAFAAAMQPLRDLEADAAKDWAAVDAQVAAALNALGQRPDAWVTSVATARLEAQRATTSGLHLGMYGWVVDVAPLSPQARDSESGWTLAPSAQHAVTASVLFAGAEAHNSTAFNMDLTSARVRSAQTLLAGLRDGSTLEELLGYQLERALHDHQLDAAIASLRNDYPLPVMPATGLPDAARTARLVVNGEAVRRDPHAQATIVALLTPADAGAVQEILQGLDHTVDAASDVLLAESVHQLIGGSPLKSGLTIDTIGNAAPPPQRLDSITTPTAAVTVTHHVAIAIGTPDGSWPSGPRAALDPAAEAIAQWTLGSAGDWLVDVTVAGGGPTTVTVSELQASALDLVVELTDPTGGSALAARARAHLGAGADGTVAVRRADGHGGDDAAALLAATARVVLNQTRAVLDPATLLDPAANADPDSDSAAARGLDDLETRITTWWTGVQSAFGGTGGDAGVLAQLARFGLAGARFDAPSSTLTQLSNQWKGVDLLAGLPTASGAAGATARLDGLAHAVRDATGDWFTAATVFGSSTGEPGTAPTTGAGNDDVAQWIACHASLRTGVSALADLLMLSGACGGAAGPQWTVRQHLAADADGPWTPPANPGAWIGGSDPGGRSGNSLAALQIGTPSVGGAMWVVVDQWSEAVPVRYPVDPSSVDPTAGHDHAAAVSLRFDSPDSRAPQALLLAVAPALPERGWKLQDLQNAVEQTLKWAMVRPVDADDRPESSWATA